MELREKRLQSTTKFEIGSQVKALYPKSAMGHRAPDKLTMPYKGPYTVLNYKDGAYELRDPTLPKPIIVSEHLLQPYVVDPEQRSPVDIAIQQRAFTQIEAIYDARGFPPLIKDLRFLIKWADEPTIDWYLWDPSFRTYPVVHDFLRDHAARTGNRKWLMLIGKDFKRDQTILDPEDTVAKRGKRHANKQTSRESQKDPTANKPGAQVAEPVSGGDVALSSEQPPALQSQPTRESSRERKKRVRFIEEM